jgi:protoporphyrinogen oxidase
MVSGFPVYEAEASPGGICCSYYVRESDRGRTLDRPAGGDAYRFERGGGHWIFGGDPAVLRFIRSLAPVAEYERRSAVFFPSEDLFVPYPLQNHLSYLGKDLAAKILQEMVNPQPRSVATQADWLERTFGPTLTDLFFGPFHQLYTAGLWQRVAPQDNYKSPVDLSRVVEGAFGRSASVGYNATFLYPADGLDAVVRRMARRVKLATGKKAAAIDLRKREIHFSDGSGTAFGVLISTLPLTVILRLTGIEVDEEPGVSNAVLVLNIGATRGPRCPSEHWIYLPDSRSGFHRVGFYHNVDRSFVPHGDEDRVSLYVERAFSTGARPGEEEQRLYAGSVVDELREWGFIGEVSVVSPTWIDVAYTWTVPGSRWRPRAMELLGENGIVTTGRYGRWHFQGIADSIRDGFVAGAALGAV